MLNPQEIQKFLEDGNDAGNGLGILGEAAKLLKKRSSIPRKVHQYKELFLKCVQAEKEHNKTPSDKNKKIFDDLSVEAG